MLHLTKFLPGRFDTFVLLVVGEKFALLQGRQVFPFALGRRCATRTRIGGFRGYSWLLRTFLILVSRSGEVVDRFAPRTTPALIEPAVRRLLSY